MKSIVGRDIQKRDYGVARRLESESDASMSATEVLRKRYDELIEAFDMRLRLEQELALEDDYQSRVQATLLNAGLNELHDQYDLPLAFSGGGVAGQLVLSGIADNLVAGSSEGTGAAPFFAGFWPSGDFGTTTMRVDEGAVVVVDMGLWFAVRFACQQVARQLTTITGATNPWGPDADDKAGEELREWLDRYVSDGVGLRDGTHLYLMRGPREDFRRELNLAAIYYVIAHESGHVVHAIPLPASAGWSEQAEVKSQWAESQADKVAFGALTRPPCSLSPLSAVMGPMLVLTIQGFALRRRIAAGDQPMHWTHWAPELRAFAAQAFLTEVNPALKPYAQAFQQWLWACLNYEQLWREEE